MTTNQTIDGVPHECRQRLVAEGKPHPKSSCKVCGVLSPKWKECDALLGVNTVSLIEKAIIQKLKTAQPKVDGVLASRELLERIARVIRRPSDETDRRRAISELRALLDKPSSSCGACNGCSNGCRLDAESPPAARPQGEPVAVDAGLPNDDIPDFTPGNGNKARRRAAAIEAMKPESQRIVPVDPFTICLSCFGSGTICTGILEASSTICNGCNGTGTDPRHHRKS